MSGESRMSAEGDAPPLDRWRTIGSLFAAGLLGVLLGFAAFALLGQRVWVPGAQALVLVLLAVGGLSGVLATMVFLRARGRETQNSWLYVAFFCVAIMAIAATQTDQLSFVQALLIIVFGSVALIAAANALSLFRLGEAIEFESSWGGLGSALGGWRLSSATSLILSAFLFACGTIVAVQVSRPQGSDTTETKAARDSGTANKGKGVERGPAAQPTPDLTAAPPATTQGPGGSAPGQPAQGSTP
jgi:hypothetical protein